MWQYLGAILAILVTLHFYFKHKFSYWSERGVKTPPPRWFLGNFRERLISDLHKAEIEWVQRYGKVYGVYWPIEPMVVIADCELLKKIFVKDFHHFVNRIPHKSYHEFWNNNLFASKDDAWKRQRMITSPSFSSAKLRAMHFVMQQNIDKLDSFFSKNFDKNKSDNFDFEVNRTMRGFTIDVIASTAFATETNSNDDPDNMFAVNGRKLFEFNPLRFFSSFVLPRFLLDLCNVKTMFDPEIFEFFVNLGRHIVGERKSGKSAKRADLIQLLIDAVADENELTEFDYLKMTATDNENINLDKNLKKENLLKSGLSDSEIVSNCILFFTAGFETTSAAMVHCLYELARNPMIQERLANELRKELDEFSDIDEKTTGEKSDKYLSIVMNELPYLEAVVKETLRRYPPINLISRKCGTDNYPLTDQITLFKDQVLLLPISAVHLNPEYYPEPHRFDPERFMPENKHLLVPYAFLPFALGPRNCIAMRFAYQEIKLCLAKIVRRYRFSPTSSTPDQLSFKKGNVALVSDPFHLKVYRR